jgi:hypothetical protein
MRINMTAIDESHDNLTLDTNASVSIVGDGSAEHFFDTLEALMTAACFHHSTFHEYLKDYAAEQLAHEQEGQESLDEDADLDSAFNMLARAGEILERSSFSADRDFAEHIANFLTEPAKYEAEPEPSNQYVPPIVPQAGDADDEMVVIITPGMIVAIDAAENLGGLFAKHPGVSRIF